MRRMTDNGAALKSDDGSAQLRVALDRITGGISVASGDLNIQLSSTFDTASGQVQIGSTAGSGTMEVVAISPSVWRLTTTAPSFHLSRTVTVEPSRVHVSDAITTRGDEPIVGIRVRHNASILSDSPVVNVTLPGAFYAPRGFACSSLNTLGDPNQLHRGTFGNPTVHVQMQHGGVGLIPLDDVFELHAWAEQTALAEPPDGPGPQHRCVTTSRPSISITDENFAKLPYPKGQHIPWNGLRTSLLTRVTLVL